MLGAYQIVALVSLDPLSGETMNLLMYLQEKSCNIQKEPQYHNILPIIENMN